MPFNQTSILEVTVFGRSDTGQAILNVFHYRQSTDDPVNYPDTEVNTFTDSFAVLWRANILPILCVDYLVEQWRGRSLTDVATNPTPPPPTVITVGAQAVTIGAPTDRGATPIEVQTTFDAIGAQKLSSRAGRNFRGSSRIGTISSSNVNGNSLEATYLTTVRTNTNTLFTTTIPLGIGADLWEMAVFSRTLTLAEAPGYSDLKAHSSKVLGSRVNPFVTSQVSRKQSLTQPT